jgi:hypothetical protein
MSPIGYHCITPKQQAFVGIDDFVQPCPPPPRASIQDAIEDVLAPVQELCDAPPGFFLAAPCNSSDANDCGLLFSKSNPVKLLPRKSRNNHFKRNSLGWAVGTPLPQQVIALKKNVR